MIKEKLKQWFKKTTHKCSPAVYPETGEVMTFYWEIPWLFIQEFQVCEECRKVEVLSEITNDNRSIPGGYKKEINDRVWSGDCDFIKIPSIGGDKLTLSK